MHSTTFMRVLTGLALAGALTGCGGNDNPEPTLSQDQAKQFEEIKQQTEALARKAEQQGRQVALQPIMHCSIGIAYLKSAKNRFASANPDFDSKTSLKADQLDAFMTDGRTCATIKCPEGGKYNLGSVSGEPTCSKCTP